ncbi:MAG: hypothetical protein ABIK31_05075 [candidate division WOR-3 bacterium]
MKKILTSKVLILLITSCALSYAINHNLSYFAKTSSLGNATVSALGEISALSNNPAVANSNKISFGLTEWLLDTRAGSLLGSYLIKNLFVFSGGISYFSYGQMQAFDEMGHPLDYFSAGLWQYQFNITKQFWKSLSVGIGIQGFQQFIADTNETKYLLNFGTIYYSDLYNIGMSVHNFSDFSFNSGVLIKAIKNLQIYLAINYQEEINIRAGLEYQFYPWALRIGYDNKHLAFGIGYEQKQFIFDYALNDYGQIGLTHQFSITIK